MGKGMSLDQAIPVQDRSSSVSRRELTGVIDRVVWSDTSSDTGDVVVIAKLRSGQTVKGRVGEGDQLQQGISYRFLGRYEHHHKHGEQFAFTSCVLDRPHGRKGVVYWLVKYCDGIGEIKASKLYDRFGTETIEVMKEAPDRIAETGLLTPDQAEEAAKVLHAESGLQDTKIALHELFAGRGFPQQQLIRACLQRWGARAPERIRQNPLTLLVRKLPGCGFKRCDKLYTDLGGRRDALKRQMLAGWYALRSDSSGHTWFDARTICRAITEAVAGNVTPAKAIKLGVRAGWLAKRRDADGALWLAEAGKARNEYTVSDRVKDLLQTRRVLWPAIPDDTPLSEHQRAKATEALRSAIGILAGTPGTGKTFTAAQIIRRVADQYGLACIGAAAPTGKAAVRLTSSLHRYGIQIQAETLHRTIGCQRDGDGWIWEHNRGNPLPYQFVIVDEVSMLDTDLAAALFDALAPGAHVLLIGDAHQLPPVGHGAPLRDLIAAGVPCGELSEIRRNSGMIVEACARIKDGATWEACAKADLDQGRNLRLVPAEKPAEAIESLRRILALVPRVQGIRAEDGTEIGLDPVWDCQVLVAVNAKSELSRKALNKLLQAELNHAGWQAPGNPFRCGDKVINLKNGWVPLMQPLLTRARGELLTDVRDQAEAYQPTRDAAGQPAQCFVANGEIGRVLAVAPKMVIARLPGPERVVKILLGKVREEDDEGESGGEGGSGEGEGRAGNGCDWDLAYACTCHKLQGSESPVVIIMIDEHSGAKRVCTREWVYTALSRASKLCVLIGKKGVMDARCKRVSLTRRKTFLKELLTNE